MKNERVTLRNGSLDELMTKLNDAEARKYDVIVPNNKILAMNGELIVKVDDKILQIEPNSTMDRHIATKLNIPYQYFERMRDTLPDLHDSSINEWLGTKETSYMLRSYLKDDDSGVTEGRALLSSSYKVIDNRDILLQMLKTIKENNLDVGVVSADISETKMYVKFKFNNIATNGYLLTENYRNPDNKQVGDTVGGGFTVTNSEVGQGAFSVLPRLDILICQNGMLRNALGMKKTHLGAKLDDGVIDYSVNTKQKNIELIMSQMNDFVQQISSQEYLEDWVDELNGKVGRELNNPIETTRIVSGMVGMSEQETDDILNYFSKSADMTSNGVLQAITFLAHEVESPDRAFDMERKAVEVLDLIPTIDN